MCEWSYKIIFLTGRTKADQDLYSFAFNKRIIIIPGLPTRIRSAQYRILTHK